MRSCCLLMDYNSSATCQTDSCQLNFRNVWNIFYSCRTLLIFISLYLDTRSSKSQYIVATHHSSEYVREENFICKFPAFDFLFCYGCWYHFTLLPLNEIALFQFCNCTVLLKKLFGSQNVLVLNKHLVLYIIRTSWFFVFASI